jgi:hypothetical protein
MKCLCRSDFGEICSQLATFAKPDQSTHYFIYTNKIGISMSNETEPLTVTIPDGCKASGLSNATMYKAINEGLVETTRVFGRRLIVYSSLKKMLGIRPEGDPSPLERGLAGGKIKDPPGRRRKTTARQETSP